MRYQYRGCLNILLSMWSGGRVGHGRGSKVGVRGTHLLEQGIRFISNDFRGSEAFDVAEQQQVLASSKLLPEDVKLRAHAHVAADLIHATCTMHSACFRSHLHTWTPAVQYHPTALTLSFEKGAWQGLWEAYQVYGWTRRPSQRLLQMGAEHRSEC
jgi:hypothetical protein